MLVDLVDKNRYLGDSSQKPKEIDNNIKSANPPDWNKFLYKELVKIRKWITFIGIVLILGLIGAILSIVP